MADGKKLDEFHIRQLSPRPQRQRIALAAHIRRCAVAGIELGQTAGGQNDGFGLKGNQLAVGQIEPQSSQGEAIFSDNLNDGDVADTTNFTDLPDLASQRRRHRWTGVEKIDIAAATTAVARRHFLFNVAVLPRPPRAPLLHFKNTVGAVLTEERGQLFVAETPPGFYSVCKMNRPVVRLLLANGCGHRHLRHDSRTAAPHKTLVEKDDRRAFSRCRDGGIHPSASGAYD